MLNLLRERKESGEAEQYRRFYTVIRGVSDCHFQNSVCTKVILRPIAPCCATGAAGAPPPEGLPARKPLVHEGVELRAVVVDGEMCVFMGNDVFDQVAGRTGEFGVVGDVAVAPVAAAPE